MFISPYQGVKNNHFLMTTRSGYVKDTRGNPEAFVHVPKRLAQEIGLFTHKGARTDLAVLSRMLFERDTWEPGRKERDFVGVTEPVVIEDGEFWLSMLCIANDLWQRWYHEDVDDAAFERFYERTKKVVGRLCKKGYLRRIRAAHPRGHRTAGSIWTFKGTLLDSLPSPLPRAPYAGMTLMMSNVSDADIRDDWVNVVDLIGSAFVSENPMAYTSGEIVANFRHRGTYTDHVGRSRDIAKKGASAERYVSVGAFKPEDTGDRDAASLLMWVVLDIDRRDPAEAYDATVEVISALEWLGAPMEHIIVSFTGGKGFHVRIPCGLMGNPIFSDPAQAQKVLRRWADDNIDTELDPSVFNPRQLIRLIGSRRTSNGVYTTAWSAEEFIKMPMHEVFSRLREHRPFDLPDPRHVPPCPTLVESLVSANDMTRIAPMPVYDETLLEREDNVRAGSVIRALESGVEEGEEWHEPRGAATYVGRNKAAFVMSLYTLTIYEGNVDTAMEAVVTWNHLNTPPLPLREIKSCMKSAIRSVERQGRRCHSRGRI